MTANNSNNDVIPTGIQTSQDAHFYGRSASFDKFSNKDKTLVVQFTVKHEQKIDCGGGYVKVRFMCKSCYKSCVNTSLRQCFNRKYELYIFHSIACNEHIIDF